MAYTYRVLSRMPTSDLRFGAAWSPLQRAKNDAFWLMASIVLTATRPLPLPALRSLGRSLGAAAHALFPGARAIARANVRRVFPELDDIECRAFVRRCFATLGELLGETVALLGCGRSVPPWPVWPTAVGPARLALRTGAAVIVGTAAPAAGDGLQVTATRIATNDLPGGDASARELTCRINEELSRRILSLPRAWVWMHERWRSQTGV